MVFALVIFKKKNKHEVRLKVRISYTSKLRTFLVGFIYFFFLQRKADGTNKRPDVIYLPLSMQKKKNPTQIKIKSLHARIY